MGVIHVEMIDVQGDVLLLLARLVPVQAVLEATGGQQQDQEYTKSTGTHRHVQQRHAETVWAVGLFLVEAWWAVTHTITPKDRADARLDLWTPVPAEDEDIYCLCCGNFRLEVLILGMRVISLVPFDMHTAKAFSHFVTPRDILLWLFFQILPRESHTLISLDYDIWKSFLFLIIFVNGDCLIIQER